MRRFLLRSSGLRALAVGAALLFAAAPAPAAEQAGRVLAASGTVVASTLGGGTRVLGDGSRVYAGERIETLDGRIQILFIDGGLMTLEPGTLFLIEAYEQHDAAAGDTDEGGSVLMNLLRGGLRTISGSIGHEEGDRYELKTPPATVGIRGTQFSLQYCSDGGCGEDVPDGLYGHVGEGVVTVDNEGGGAVFGGGSFFRVAGIGDKPVPILQPPGPVLRGTRPQGGDEDDSDQGDAGSGAAVAAAAGAAEGAGPGTGRSRPLFSESQETGTEVTAGPPTPPGGGMGGPGGGMDDPGGGMDDPDPVLTPLDGAAVAVGFIGGGVSDGGACSPPATGCTAAIDDDKPNGNLASVKLGKGGSTFEVGSGPDGPKLKDKGGLEAFDFKVVWGRWAGDISVKDSTTDGDLLWAYSTNATTTAELVDVFQKNEGMDLEYNLAGGPSPISTSGEMWNVDKLSVIMSVNVATANIKANHIKLNLSGPGSIKLHNPVDLKKNFINPGAAKGGFNVDLTDSMGGLDKGSIEGQFIGDEAGGMLVGFEARDVNDSGVLDTVRGVNVLTKK